MDAVTASDDSGLLRPLAALVPDARAYFKLAVASVQRAKAEPGDPLSNLSAALFAFHLADWDEDSTSFRATSPDFGTLREVANGTKHARLRPEQNPNPKVLGTHRFEGYGSGPYGVGSYGAPYIGVQTLEGDPDGRWVALVSVIERTLTYWAERNGVDFDLARQTNTPT